jgi:hypothetical protein
MIMDINELFDGIAEAFRRYQQETAAQKNALPNPISTGLEPERESEQSEKIMPTEKGVKQHFPK